MNNQINIYKLKARCQVSISLVVFILLASSVNGQSTSKEIDTFFGNVRTGKSPNLPAEIYKADNAKAILAALPVYAKDTVVLIRGKAALIARVVGTKSAVAPIRQQAVTQIIQAASDKNTGNAGSALNYLTEFKKSDFTKVHRDSLIVLFRRNPPYMDVLAKLVGFLDIKELKNDLFALSQNSAFGRKEPPIYRKFSPAGM